MKRRAYSRVERKTQVIQTIAIAIQHFKPNAMTTNQLAKALEITPSTKFREILFELHVEGRLSGKEIPHQGVAGKAFVWSLPEGSYTLPKPKTRQISLNFKGKSAGQLELFAS